MLWITGIVSALKGMVKVPNIIGKTTTEAAIDLTNAHLTNTGNTTETTGDTNLGNKIKSVTPDVDTLVDYESNVSYVSYVFSFTPFSVFSFFGVFSFTPFSVFGFSPGCIDEDTLVTVVGENDTIQYKKAKELNVEDEVWTATWDELVDESISPFSVPSDTMTNITTVKTTIKSIFPSTKSTTIYFNNDIRTRFSLEEKVLVKRDGVYSFLVTASIELGDYLVQRNEDGSYSEIIISDIQTIDEDRTVYKFNAEPVDTLLAANLIVHNIKDRY